MAEPQDIYMQSLLPHRRGHALWTPEPEWDPSPICTGGVEIGDIGMFNLDGSFDVLFNACQPASHWSNMEGLPEDFTPLLLNEGTLKARSDKEWASVVSPSVVGVGISEGLCFSSHSSGAALVLPHGAYREDMPLDSGDAVSHLIKNFGKLANFASTRRRRPKSLFFVSGTDKAKSWGLAALPESGGDGKLILHPLLATGSRWGFSWEGGDPATVRFSMNSTGSCINQTIFLRGFTMTGRPPLNCDEDDEEGMCQPYNPSAVINEWLLKVKTEAFVAVTHDDIWCAVVSLEDVMPLPDDELLRRVHEKFEPKLQDGGVFLVPRVLLVPGIQNPKIPSSAIASYLSDLKGVNIKDQLAHADYVSHLVKSSNTSYGSFSEIYAGKWLDNTVALAKVSQDKSTGSKAQMRFQGETSIWESPRLPKMSLSYDIFNHAYIALQKYKAGLSLHDNDIFIRQQKQLMMKIQELRADLEHLHSQHIVHGDIRAPNILTSPNDVGRLSDFGLSEVLAKTHQGASRAPRYGTVAWLAPGLSEETGPTAAHTDAWSFGVLALKLFNKSCENGSPNIIVPMDLEKKCSICVTLRQLFQRPQQQELINENGCIQWKVPGGLVIEGIHGSSK